MSRRPTDDRAASFSIGRLISALDDRNPLRALRLLEPAAQRPQLSPEHQDEAPRCVRCATRGE
jgi:hypothetical protein